MQQAANEAEGRLASQTYRAYSLLLRAAAEHLGLDVRACLASHEHRHAVSRAFAVLWLAIELGCIEALDESQQRSSPGSPSDRPVRIRPFSAKVAYDRIELSTLAKGLTPEGIREVFEASGRRAFDVPVERWERIEFDRAVGLERAIVLAFSAQKEAFGDTLRAWLADPKTVRRLSELFAVLIERAFADRALPSRALPRDPAFVQPSEAAGVLALWGAQYTAPEWISHIVEVGRSLTAQPPSPPERVLAALRHPQTATVHPSEAADDVQFTVFRPNAICPHKVYPLIAFVHLSSKRPESPADEPAPHELARKQAEAILGSRLSSYGQVTSDGNRAIPNAAHLTFVPSIADAEVWPSQQSVLWTEDVHRVEFQIRTSAAMLGKSVAGVVTVYWGPLIVATMSVSIRVVAADVPAPVRIAPAQTTSVYRKIFASYSHADGAIVEYVRGVVSALGDRYSVDVTELRSGERWSERLAELISEASVFQLFWSHNSMRSDFVRHEWQYALGLKRDGFVRPTYWHEPLPSAPGLPPPELAALHFARLPLPRPISVGTQGSTSEPVSADTPTASPVVPSAKAAKRTSLRMLLIRVAALVSALGVIALSIIAPEFRKEDDRPPISRPPITSHIDAHPLPAIQIQTDPPGASIYEGGKLLGSSPLAIARPADDITRRFTVRGSDGSEMPLEVTARSGDVVMLTMHSEEPPAVEPVTPPPVQVEPTKQIPRRSPTRPRQPQAQPVAPDDLQRNPYPEPSEQTPRRAPVSPRQPRTQPVAPDDILLNPYR